MKYYISDLHIGDERIMHLCKRPYKSIAEQTQVFLNNWNNLVRPDDEVFILGDVGFAWTNEEKGFYLAANGVKHLVFGNHDVNIIEGIRNSNIFASCDFILNVEDEGENIVLCHYPLMDWEGIDNDWLLFYGHIHNKPLHEIYAYYNNKKAYNVSVDVTNYVPMTKEQIKERKLCI